jgi:hypothetical protein
MPMVMQNKKNGGLHLTLMILLQVRLDKKNSRGYLATRPFGAGIVKGKKHSYCQMHFFLISPQMAGIDGYCYLTLHLFIFYFML